jgi:hypothetical protein
MKITKQDLITIIALMLITAIATIYVMRMFDKPKALDNSAEISRIAKLSQTYKKILLDKESIIKSLKNAIGKNNEDAKVIYIEIGKTDTLFIEVPRAERQEFADSLSNQWLKQLNKK